MHRTFTVLAILLGLAYTTWSAALPRLDAKGAAEIDRMFQAAVGKGEIPGVVAVVTNKDQILYLKAFGKRDA